MGPVVGTRPVGGSALRETASERKANKEGSLDILGKVRQIVETWNQQMEEITHAVSTLSIDANFKITGQGFTIGLTRTVTVGSS